MIQQNAHLCLEQIQKPWGGWGPSCSHPNCSLLTKLVSFFQLRSATSWGTSTPSRLSDLLQTGVSILSNHYIACRLTFLFSIALCKENCSLYLILWLFFFVQPAIGNIFIFVERRLPLCTILECTLITGWKDLPQSPAKALAPAQNDAHIARWESAKERRGGGGGEEPEVVVVFAVINVIHSRGP